MTGLRLVRPALVALALLGAAACTSDPGSGGSGGAQPVTQDVVAADGATVEDTAGDVSLQIPPGSLEADATLTLTIGPAEAETAAPTYTFAPAGLVLDPPGTLAIAADGVTVPAGKVLVAASRAGSAWVEIPGSVVGSGIVEAPIAALASFSLILVDEAVAGPCDETCMAQAGAECCTACGCQAPVSCAPVCVAPAIWDCEVGCCFDYELLTCV